jgi:cytosine/adenosine deaminase-related metal-dependent hydrolase
MVSLRGNALLGSELTFTEDVIMEIDEKGIITNISKESKQVDYFLPSSHVIVPGFINAHIHLGDAFLKDHTYGCSLEEAVGPQGIKHSKLNLSTSEVKIDSLRNSLEMLVQNGYTSFVDFREGGTEGITLLKNVLKEFSIRGIVLGRRSEGETFEEISESCDGLGIRDVFILNQDDYLVLSQLKTKNPSMLIGIHVSESDEVTKESVSKYGKRDIPIVLESDVFDFVVHANYAEDEELKLLEQKNIGIICCPISSLYYGLKFPPLEQIQRKGILLGLGTDNVLSNNPDPFRLMAFTLYNAKANEQEISPKEVLKSLTVNVGLLLKENIGQLEIGYSGDLLAIDLESCNLKFSKDVYTAITMRADQSDISLQMFKGKVIKWRNQK